MNETTKEKFLEILGKFDTAVLATITSAGEIHARPMAIFLLEPNADILFITDEASAKVHEIEREPRATIICQDGWTCNATVTGSASLFRDTELLKKHWRKTFQAWFPNGPDDQSIVLVRVRAERGEFWDNSGFKAFRYLFQASKAVVTGTRPNINERDQHAKVTLK